MGFRQGAIISSVSFLLGTLFISFAQADYRVLFEGTGTTASEEALLAAERYYLTFWQAPLAVKALLHAIIGTCLVNLALKFATWTEAAFFFDGGSLVLLIFSLAIYAANTIKNVKLLSLSPSSTYLLQIPSLSASSPSTTTDGSLLSSLLSWGSKTLSSPPPPSSSTSPSGISGEAEVGLSEEKRLELISVVAAGHLLMILLLVGILVLQAGQGYAEKVEEREREKAIEKEREKEREKKSQ